jgi:predicted patatin/cPLA2 family phospholipase
MSFWSKFSCESKPSDFYQTVDENKKLKVDNKELLEKNTELSVQLENLEEICENLRRKIIILTTSNDDKYQNGKFKLENQEMKANYDNQIKHLQKSLVQMEEIINDSNNEIKELKNKKD